MVYWGRGEGGGGLKVEIQKFSRLKVVQELLSNFQNFNFKKFVGSVLFQGITNSDIQISNH